MNTEERDAALFEKKKAELIDVPSLDDIVWT